MELYDVSAESAIIGACLENNRVIEKCEEVVTAESFYLGRHKIVFQTICDMKSQKVPVDLVTIVDELRKQNRLDIVGGAAFVASLTDNSVSSANIGHYLAIVDEFSIRRKLLDLGKSIIEKCQEQSTDVPDIKSDIDKRMLELDRHTQAGYIAAKDLVIPTVNSIQYDYEHRRELKGIPTGIEDLDFLTNGWQAEGYYIIAARPSVGKTAEAVQNMYNVAVQHKIPTGFFSAEMSANLIMRRLISHAGRVDSHKINSGMITTADMASIQDAAGTMYESVLYINDTPNIMWNDLKSQARLMVRQQGVKIIFIDYIGLITYENSKLAFHEQLAAISKGLKGLARELKIPLIVLSQVTRDTEGKEPTLKDLAGTRALEQDSDFVMFLHRIEPKTDYERNQLQNDGVDNLRFIIAKNRNGPTGVFNVTHKKAYGLMRKA